MAISPRDFTAAFIADFPRISHQLSKEISQGISQKISQEISQECFSGDVPGDFIGKSPEQPSRSPSRFPSRFPRFHVGSPRIWRILRQTRTTSQWSTCMTARTMSRSGRLAVPSSCASWETPSSSLTRSSWARDFPADLPAAFPAHPGISQQMFQQVFQLSQRFPSRFLRRFPSSAMDLPRRIHWEIS